jgi:hypothetical protein
LRRQPFFHSPANDSPMRVTVPKPCGTSLAYWPSKLF